MAAFVGPGVALIRLLMHCKLEAARVPAYYVRFQLWVMPPIICAILRSVRLEKRSRLCPLRCATSDSRS